jgi:hypothetical protein
MNPVTRALQTIAAIESETREVMHAEAASRCPVESLRSKNLSASSLASSNGRDRSTAPSATSKGTTNLNRRSGAPPIAQVNATGPIAQVKATRSQAALARDREIRIDKQDRVLVAPAHDVTCHGVTIITGALLLALSLCLGWIGGLNSDSLFIKPAWLSVESSSHPLDPSAKSERLTVQGSSANTNATATIKRHETSKRNAQTSESLLTKQTISTSQPPSVERTKISTKPEPVPETRPTTIEGWTLLEVKGGTAVLEGPNGVWRATRGDGTRRRKDRLNRALGQSLDRRD